MTKTLATAYPFALAGVLLLGSAYIWKYHGRNKWAMRKRRTRNSHPRNYFYFDGSPQAKLSRLYSDDDRSWKKTRTGNFYRMGGRWSKYVCKRCGKVRNAYPEVGTWFKNYSTEGDITYRFKAFPKSNTGSNYRMNALTPPLSSKPLIDCKCLYEP